MTMLAQIADIAPDWLRNMAIFIACGAATFYYVRGGMQRSQKREISFSETPASKIEFDRHLERNEGEHRELHARIGGVDRGAGGKISSEITLVHNRVNALEKSVGGLETAAEITNQRLSQIDAKIDRLIERK